MGRNPTNQSVAELHDPSDPPPGLAGREEPLARGPWVRLEGSEAPEGPLTEGDGPAAPEPGPETKGEGPSGPEEGPETDPGDD